MLPDRVSNLRVRCPTDCATWPGDQLGADALIIQYYIKFKVYIANKEFSDLKRKDSEILPSD